jgi:hypothetical protein
MYRAATIYSWKTKFGNRGIAARQRRPFKAGLLRTKPDVLLLRYCPGSALATSCAQPMNSRATGLSVRAFNEMAPIGRGVDGKFMGRPLKPAR